MIPQSSFRILRSMLLSRSLEVGSSLNCTVIDKETIDCGGEHFHEEEHSLEPSDSMFWFFLCSSIVLTLFAGMMSGLTIGYFSLNMTNLSVIMKGKNEKQRKMALKVLPLLKRKHMLLVTLLLSNAFAMEALPLCIDRIASPIAAIILSVSAVLFFGEVIPQSICSRYGLQIGSFFSYFIIFLMVVTSPVSYPISKLLDYLLGHDHGLYYKREELVELVNMHGENNDDNQEPLTTDEVTIIRGALEMKNKNAVDCMTPLQNVFMLSDKTILDSKVLKLIVEKGHSRIPIYHGENKQDVVGLLMAKRLIQLDVSSPVSIESMQIDSIMRFEKDFPLYSILNEFQTGRSHISLVCDGASVLGIITIEDVIEELIQEEILDETDALVAVQQKVKAVKLIELERRATGMGSNSKDKLDVFKDDHSNQSDDIPLIKK